ncbi:MAG: UDP-N-acetylmuramate:L-alanyl-gamma-D-glutamyl-meso-diaminopimelate ligase [Gammaproteobacteria bacterium]|nr:UDP-N-acetylmuramate:L-alanyl-gamma-D-glutamyl-meso-diaminopimelate ligase [Gammaproteobacteria bacterium]
MKIFIAGICGTFMAGVAQLAKAGGHAVRGCDHGVYPPMNEVLAAQSIDALSGYRAEHLGDAPGTVLLGNALSRGNELVEAVLARRLEFQSGPEWLRAHVLARRAVLAVAGTHGKTSTTSMLAWMLQCAGRAPGYLIGGKPGNFETSAALGEGEHFVIEADEYDTAFFDKRAKFVHYHPRIAVLNNLEFDHADIYDDLAQIKKQFHHLVRTVPGDGGIVVNADDANLAEVLEMGCWSEVTRFSLEDESAEWHARALGADCAEFEVLHRGAPAARVAWRCIGRHNMQNALAAIAAAQLAGVPPAEAAAALKSYIPGARRMQLLHQSAQLSVYDDFAHHPTAILHSIDAARARHPDARIFVALELRSNTMKSGAHGARVGEALARADGAVIRGASGKDLPGAPRDALLLEDADEIIGALKKWAQNGANSVIITMSNGDFGGLPRRLAAEAETWRGN